MKRTLVAMVLALTGSGSALALDLKKAKLPVEYECRATHQAGIALDVEGNWFSGGFSVDKTPIRLVLERHNEVQSPVRRGACDLESPKKFRSADAFCLTAINDQINDEQANAHWHCQFSDHSMRRRDFSQLICNGYETFLDTDRGFLISARGGAKGFAVGSESPSAGVFKADCVRLDR